MQAIVIAQGDLYAYGTVVGRQGKGATSQQSRQKKTYSGGEPFEINNYSPKGLAEILACGDINPGP